jgi:hypothetical protein
MTQHVQQPAQHSNRAATLARTAAQARRQVLLRRRHQEAVATARAVGHRSRLVLGPPAGPAATPPGVSRLACWPGSWSQGKIDQHVVRADWADGQLCCDRLLEVRARLLIDLGAEFGSDDPPRRYPASLQAPPVAVLVTLIRACDLTTADPGL